MWNVIGAKWVSQTGDFFGIFPPSSKSISFPEFWNRKLESERSQMRSSQLHHWSRNGDFFCIGGWVWALSRKVRQSLPKSRQTLGCSCRFLQIALIFNIPLGLMWLLRKKATTAVPSYSDTFLSSQKCHCKQAFNSIQWSLRQPQLSLPFG